MKTKNIFLAAIATLALGACQNDNVEFNKPVKANIYANLNNKGLATRAYGQTWSANDAIGLFVNEGNYKYTFNGNKETTINNEKFVNTAGVNTTATFSSDTDVLFPSDGSEITFHAYYPYNPNLDGYLYEVTNWDVQSNLGNEDSNPVDLLISDNPTGSQSSNNVELKFSHVFSKLRLRITTNSEESQLVPSDLTNMTVKANGLSASINCNVLDGTISNVTDNGKAINFKTNTKGVEYEAVICPNFKSTSTTPQIIFTYVDSKGTTKNCTWNIPSTQSFAKGVCYDYTIRLRGDGLAEAILTGTINPWTVEDKNPSIGYIDADNAFH